MEGAVLGILSLAAVVVLFVIYRDPADPREEVRAMARERLARGEAMPYDQELAR